MHRGYVRDYRKGIEHPLFSRPLIWHFWSYCRLRANHKETVIDFNGLPLKLERGCFVMSIGSASKDTGLTTQNIRTAIKILSSHKMIEKSTSEVTKQATIIKVLKYDLYQPLPREGNKVTNEVLTKSQQGANKVLTTDKNVNNVKKVNKKDIPQNEFAEQEFYLSKKKRKLDGKRLITFLRFWEDFNYKKDKASAADSWLDIPQLTDGLVNEICNSAKIEAQNRSNLISSGSTPIFPQGWLTARRWEDEQGPQQSTNDNGSEKAQKAIDETRRILDEG